MAKKSCKRPARLKNDNAGCMWGLLGIFDFRQGRRLLSDKRLGSATRQGGTVHSKNKFDALSNLEGMHEDVSDAVDVERINSSKASNKIPSSIVEQRVDMCIGANIEKNQIKTNKNSKPSPSSRSDRSEISSFDINLLNLVVEFCGENHEKLIESNGDRKDMHDNLQLNQNHYVLQKDLGDMIEALLARKSFDSKQVTTNGCFEAIDRLNLNKDILQKLLQDPDSLLFKHVQDLQNARSHEIFQHNRSDLKRIVVLKPSTYTISPISSSPELLHDLRHQEGTDKVSFHFSIKGIKRRMRSMVGESKKKQDSIARDGILHKIPYGGNNKASKFSTFLKKGDRMKVERLIASHPLDKESGLYDEAKKRLAEFLGLDAEDEVSSPRQSLTGYRSLSSLSPRSSPAREDDSTCSVASSPATGNSPPCSENHSDDGSPPINSDPRLPETRLHVGEDPIKKGSSKTEECDSLCLPEGELGCVSEIHNEKESVAGPSEEAVPMTPSISISKSENTIDRRSPVSVLEPLFSEDINSNTLERTEIDHAKLKAEPQLLRFEEEEYNDSQLAVPTPTKFQHVRSVLEASSGLDYNKHPERWQSSDQLLDDPFVYDEVEILYGHLLIDGSKLLFDCINEVLVEMKERYTPWISFIKPNIRPLPTGENFVHQVCKGVDKHLQIVVPYTLDGVIRKDLECGTFWMNVWMESECAVAEIGEVILEYIMEETILELWE